MEADDRSLTPPLPKKVGENGKQIISSLYDKIDQVDIHRSTPLSTIVNKLGLHNYNSTSEEENGEIIESNSKSKSNQSESTKSTVINTKNRKSEDRDRNNRRNRRRSRDSSFRGKSKDRKHHRSSSKHRNDNFHNRRRRSRSKGRSRFQSPKDIQKEPPRPRGEIRRTVTEPVIEYCDNGRFPNPKWPNNEPKQKVRRVNDSDTVNFAKKFEEADEQQTFSNDTTDEGSNTPIRDKTDVSVNIELEISSNKLKKNNEDDSRPALERDRTPEKKQEHKKVEELVKSDENHSSLNDLDLDLKLSPKKPPTDKFDVESPTKTELQSESMDVTSTTEHSVSVKAQRNKSDESKALNEDKMQQYIDEYEFFIQQVSSPVSTPKPNLQPDEIRTRSPLKLDIFATSPKNERKSISPKNCRNKSPSPEINRKESPPLKINRKKTPSRSSSSSSSSSSSDDDSSSSSSSSSSDDDSDSSSDSSSSSDSDKSDSDSSSSRSNSKSPRPSKSVNSNYDLNRLNLIVGNDKPSNNDAQSILKSSFSLPPGDINISVDALKSLDDLINFEDDDDLLNSIQSYKNHMRELKMAKETAEKSKLDGTVSNDNRTNDTSMNLENGALLHESERKKISMKLKPTTTLKPQTNDINEPFIDNEHQDTHRTSNDKQIYEQNDQIEKNSHEKSMSSKKKSSYRKDERKSRRSEDRKSRSSEDTSRSKRSEDRRSHRNEEKRSKRSEDHRSKRSEDRHSRRSEDRRSRRSEEKRHRRS